MSRPREWVAKWTDVKWRRFERAVHEPTLAMDPPPLEHGGFIEWTFHVHMETTDRYTPIHCVPDVEKQTAFCRENIPAASRRDILVPGWVETQERCLACEIAFGNTPMVRMSARSDAQ